AEDGHSAIIPQDSVTLIRVRFQDGVIGIAATLPAMTGRTILDVSCKQSFCLVLTREPPVGGKLATAFWAVSLADGAVTAVRSHTAAYRLAKVSPASNAVVVLEPDGLHLFTDLLR